MIPYSTGIEIEDMNNMLDYYAKRQVSMTDLSPSAKRFNWDADKA